MSILAGFKVPHPPMIVPVEEMTRAYMQVAEEIAALKPETIIITSPHSVMYADYFHISPGRKSKGSFEDFRAGGVKFEEFYDEELPDLNQTILICF